MTRASIELPYKPLFDVGEGETIILLHGLIGNQSNWFNVAFELTGTNRVIVPRLPFFVRPISSERLEDIIEYLKNFIEYHQLTNIVLMGNSSGTHIALRYDPTHLVWGLQDTITPPEVVSAFQDRQPNSQLILLDHCGHVPTMEQPKPFNQYVREYLDQPIH